MKQNKFNLFRKPKTEGYKVTAIAAPPPPSKVIMPLKCNLAILLVDNI